jgi:integrase
MATVKPVLDKRYKSKDNTFQIVVRIRHGSQVRDMGTGYKVQEKYWDGEKVKVAHEDARLINSIINNLVSQAKQYIAECQLHKRPIKLDLIGKDVQSYSWNDYLLHRAKQYAAKEQYIMERKLLRFDREFRVFSTPGLSFADLLEDEKAKKPPRGAILYFDSLSADKIRDYDAFLIQQGNGANTRAKKFKFLTQFYDNAIKEGKATGPNPFEDYKVLSKPVKKEKLTDAEVKAIEELDLQPGPVNDARNLWLFSYYCKGNRFETCITCRRDMIVNGRIVFKMNKGEKFVSVKIHSRLQAIIDQYQGDGEFLFPYVTDLPKDKKQYIKKIDSLNVVVNRNLKILAALAGVKTKLTFHIARHTFATHLQGVSDNIHVIKESLGHSSTRTTEIYLKSLGDEKLDKEMDKLYGA